MLTELHSIAADSCSQILLIFLVSACLSAALVLFVILIARPPSLSAMGLRMTSRPWSTGHVGLLTATVLVGMGALPLLLAVARRFGLQDWELPSYSWLAIAAIFMHLPCLAVIRTIMRLEHISISDGFGITRDGTAEKLATGVFLALATLPVLAVVMALYLWFLMRSGVQCDPQSVAMMIKDTAGAPWPLRVAIGVLTVILVPAVEELMFRGIAFPAACKRVGFLPGVILVSLVFAVIHVEVTTYAPLFVFSAALCFAYAHSGSILVPFAMHATHNLIQVALLPFFQLQ